MNTTKLLVRKILERAEHYDWSLQGFGMFRLYLSKEQRLHVWDSRFAVENVSTLHTHPWHFRSTVISGRMVDRLYEHKEGRLTLTHMKQLIVCGPGGGECRNIPPFGVRLELLQEVSIGEGRSYSLTADAIHESWPDPGTVTIIEREFREDTEHAFVFYPVGTSWVSAEPRPATRGEVSSMAALALVKMR